MPDIKPQVYKDPRPPEYFARFHERSRTHDPDWVYDVARILVTPPCPITNTVSPSDSRCMRARAFNDRART